MDKEIIYIIVFSVSYFAGYYIRAYQDNLLFYKTTGLSMLECLDIIRKEMMSFEQNMYNEFESKFNFQDEKTDDGNDDNDEDNHPIN